MVTEETWFFPEFKIESHNLSDYSSLLISFHTQELDLPTEVINKKTK